MNKISQAAETQSAAYSCVVRQNAPIASFQHYSGSLIAKKDTRFAIGKQAWGGGSCTARPSAPTQAKSRLRGEGRSIAARTDVAQIKENRPQITKPAAKKHRNPPDSNSTPVSAAVPLYPKPPPLLRNGQHATGRRKPGTR